MQQKEWPKKLRGTSNNQANIDFYMHTKNDWYISISVASPRYEAYLPSQNIYSWGQKVATTAIPVDSV